jgi:hypothetical protein
MIRQLCFAAVAVLFAVSNCSANIIIDDFKSATATAATTGFGYTSNAGYAADTDGETLPFPVFAAGTSASLDYIVLPNLDGQGSLVFDFAVGGGPIDLTVTTSDGTAVEVSLPVSLVAGATPTTVNIGASLSTATSLTLDFENNSGADATFTFGSSSGSFTAIPEPTSLLMFPAAIGLVLARRRRKN